MEKRHTRWQKLRIAAGGRAVGSLSCCRCWNRSSSGFGSGEMTFASCGCIADSG